MKRVLIGSLVVVFCLATAVAGPRESIYEDNHRIAVGPASFDVRQPAASQLPAGWAHDAEAGADPYRLVKFPGPVGSRERALLEERGFDVISYYPFNAFLVRPAAGRSLAELASLEEALWTGPFHPYFKLAPGLADVVTGNFEVDPEWGARFTVALHEERHRAAAASALSAIRGVTLFETRGTLRIRVQPEHLREALRTIARIPFVSNVEAWREARPSNDELVQIVQSGVCDAGGPEATNTTLFNQGLTGWNARIAVADNCIDVNEGWFYDDTLATLPPQEPSAPWTSVAPDWGQRKIVEYYDMYSADTTLGCNGLAGCSGFCPDHGTHVAGTVAGNCSLDIEGLATATDPGNRDGDNDGLAPGARIVAQDMGDGTLFYLNVDGGELGELIDVAYTNTCDGGDCGVDIHNNSWNIATDGYEVQARTADRELWDLKDLVAVVSAGNVGVISFDSIRTPATAKNTIGVGSALECGAQDMVLGSGRGDTSDGRLKPDIVASGDMTNSALNDGDGTTNANGGCQVTTIGGTSMAAAATSGLAALTLQYYQDGFYPTGAANAPDAFDPSGMLLKATLIHSGTRMTGAGAEREGVTWPNMDQGWGYVVLDNALYFAGDPAPLWIHDEPAGVDVSGTSSLSFQRGVTGPEPLKVTLVWYDKEHPGGCGFGSPCLLNDLDLTVTDDTTGAEYAVTVVSGSPGHIVPRTLVADNPGVGQVSTDFGRDSRNTVEQIIIYNPTSPANYTFTVTASNTPDGPIPFALVATGDLAAACPEPTLPAANNTATDLSLCEGTGVEISWDQDADDWADGGSGPRFYQVLRDGAPITGGGCGGTLPYGTTSCVDDTAPDDTSFQYSVRYRNACGGTSITAGEPEEDATGLIVDVTPDGTNAVCPGDSILLSTAVNPGGGSYLYQWQEDGVDMPGENGPTLSVSKTELGSNRYNCVVEDTVTGCIEKDPDARFRQLDDELRRSPVRRHLRPDADAGRELRRRGCHRRGGRGVAGHDAASQRRRLRRRRECPRGPDARGRIRRLGPGLQRHRILRRDRRRSDGGTELHLRGRHGRRLRRRHRLRPDPDLVRRRERLVGAAGVRPAGRHHARHRRDGEPVQRPARGVERDHLHGARSLPDPAVRDHGRAGLRHRLRHGAAAGSLRRSLRLAQRLDGRRQRVDRRNESRHLPRERRRPRLLQRKRTDLRTGRHDRFLRHPDRGQLSRRRGLQRSRRVLPVVVLRQRRHRLDPGQGVLRQRDPGRQLELRRELRLPRDGERQQRLPAPVRDDRRDRRPPRSLARPRRRSALLGSFGRGDPDRRPERRAAGQGCRPARSAETDRQSLPSTTALPADRDSGSCGSAEDAGGTARITSGFREHHRHAGGRLRRDPRLLLPGRTAR